MLEFGKIIIIALNIAAVSGLYSFCIQIENWIWFQVSESVAKGVL